MQVILQNCDAVDISWVHEFMEINGLREFAEVVHVPENHEGLVLKAATDGLFLFAASDQKTLPTRVDFLAGSLRHRLATSTRHDGLPKAVGLDKTRGTLHVLDATAGMGIDAYQLAAMGCWVTLLEKSPVMAVLLADGLRRGRLNGNADIRDALGRMNLQVSDAHDWLAHLQPDQRPDVICLDPMFPPRQKSARVKKDMALMQRMLPPNEDIDVLLKLARRQAKKRVVLKRPGKANKKTIPKPDFQVPGKACHFQVFLCN
jgi:16S rRNA (guanine1516-N2)-methyltransferase